MRIVFMGTPDFAAKSLEKLYKERHDEIVGVFTQPDKPRNRGLKVSYSPVKELALSHKTPIFQPATLKNNESADILRNIECDLLIVVAYGKILPKELIEIPKFGAINIHGSLLPKYRGAAPIQWAIMNGENKTGVTSQFITEEIDAGDIILKKETSIDEEETTGELFQRLSILGAELLIDTVKLISSGTVIRKPQDKTLATFAPLITKDMIPINWSKSAFSIKCHVRALAPKPGATFDYEELKLKVFKTEIGSRSIIDGIAPGKIISKGNHGIEVACADGTVLVTELQAPGGKRMSAADFLRGRE